jgi:peroxin-1
LITTLSIINEHNEPKILGERERALLTKYLEDNVKVFPFTAAI